MALDTCFPAGMTIFTITHGFCPHQTCFHAINPNMPNNDKSHLNRRKEQRLPLHDLTLKIRKTGLGMQGYELCRSVDLSLNGLAFASDTLALKVPEKIDFILTIEAHEIKGAGVICNRRDTDKGFQYGLIFISVSPEISSVFDYGELSTQELENLAKNLAEQFVMSFQQFGNTHDKLLLLKQQQLFDACRNYLLRLGEMGLRMFDANQQLLQPIQAVRIFRDKQGVVVLQWHCAASKTTEQLAVKLENHALSAVFIIDEIPVKTVLQVLDILGQRIKNGVQFI